jgi:hypothetical protein
MWIASSHPIIFTACRFKAGLPAGCPNLYAL